MLEADRSRIVNWSPIDDAVRRSQEASSISTPLQPLTTEELDAPIDVSTLGDSSVPSAADSGFTASIPGYLPIAVIGRGGQGIVVRAIQTSTKKAVAIKILSGGRFASTHAASRFNREAEILARIDHPNIVSITDRGLTTDGSSYLVMPLITGTDLASHVAGFKDHREIARLFAKIAFAVGVLHEKNICHRDLKPTNVLIDRNGEPRILDFGLALDRGPADFTAVTETGQILGSLAWTSPEQASGNARRVSSQSDVYSLGVMLFVATHGHPPYSSEGSLHDVVGRICRKRPKICIEGQLASTIARCLEKRPERRYRTGKDLAAALDSAAVSRPPFVTRKRRLIGTGLISIGVTCGLAFGVDWKGLLKTAGPATFSEPVVYLPERTIPVGIKMLEIPAGSFVMGSPPSESGHVKNETQHRVTISKPFWISSTLVTRAEYAKGAGVTVDPKPDPRLPMTEVSWFDANGFCVRLAKLDPGHTYRLPTEAEWEYACRASSGSEAFPGTVLSNIAWFESNSAGNPHPVGQRSPNRWGLFDAVGNVYQWCADLDGSTGESPVGSLKAIRGGSFRSSSLHCRSGFRGQMPADSKADDLGFRVVSE